MREGSLPPEGPIPEGWKAITPAKHDRSGEDAFPAEQLFPVAKRDDRLLGGRPGWLEVQIDSSEIAEAGHHPGALGARAGGVARDHASFEGDRRGFSTGGGHEIQSMTEKKAG
jgi:hypothetical protein